MKTAKLTGPALAGALIVLWTATASAGTVYSQNFDTGSATFTTNDPYWTNSGEDNGYIVEPRTASEDSVMRFRRTSAALAIFSLTAQWTLRRRGMNFLSARPLT